ncbi:hypothetical protein QQ045_020470 [Rhodiola kirilowii]
MGIAFLTLEKACVSEISNEDTTGSIKKRVGIFKDRLRELGGLDSVFKVEVDCYSYMEGWLKKWLNIKSGLRESIDREYLKFLALLLNCLKIMENATFLSKDNQLRNLISVDRFQRNPEDVPRLELPLNAAGDWGVPILWKAMMTLGLVRKSIAAVDGKSKLEDSDDRFAFDEEELGPSLWNLLSKKHKVIKDNLKWMKLSLSTQLLKITHQDERLSIATYSLGKGGCN